MASFKVILRPEKKRDGTSALAIRVTKDRRSTYVYLDCYIPERDWDAESQKVKKSHKNSGKLNYYIITKLAEIADTGYELQTQKSGVSALAIKGKIKPKAGASFAAQGALYLERLRASGKYNRYTADKPRVKHFKDFLPSGDISLSEINVGLLERFKIYLKVNHNISERTIINHLVVIRSIISQAIKEGVVDEKHYPFGKGKIVIKFPQSTKVGISIDDVARLETVELNNSDHDHARNLWLISYYFAGMRISDVLRLKRSDIQDGRLHYTMGKNHKAGSIKILDKAKCILEKYQCEVYLSSDFIFPDLKVLSAAELENDFLVQRKIAFVTSRYDKFLRLHVAPAAKIDKTLTMHIARHTFATNAGDKVPIQMLQKLYRHSSITTTIGYQANFINKDADDALDAVIGL